MMTPDLLERRRQEIAASTDLSALLARLAERARPVLEHLPSIPAAKALLSADGGVCPQDGTALIFDPWSPAAHRCPTCGQSYTGERHDRAWAYSQHLWLAERAAHLATLAALDGRADAAERAAQLLGYYADHYGDYPNRDNVLGPSRLFFSTYLESIWITNYLAAAVLLRSSGALSEHAVDGISSVADEAANLIGEFDEGLSNRQTWHNAALAAIAVWFDDEELVTGVVERESGMIGHLLHGFGGDGLWYEGENYHLFALRGQLVGLHWARLAGIDLTADPRLAAVLEAALRAPALTALPDGTFPARKDARFGVSLAQPMYLESWEVGLAALGRRDTPLWSWLRALYASDAPPAQRFDSYLHEAGEPAPARPRTRADLSWWALVDMAPAFPDDAPAWTPESLVLHDQGLAILRREHQYVSLESGAYGGGHGHPDRLHLTLHAAGVHWLPDFGTGSYVARDLFWYRSTLAHNAPRLDGVSQSPGDAVCEYFDRAGEWAWTRGRYGDLVRTVVVGPEYILDVVELNGSEDHLLELPWHLAGQGEMLTPGQWTPDELASEFVQAPERFVPVDRATTDEYVLRTTATGPDGSPATCTVRWQAIADLLRAQAPGAPGTAGLATFYVLRAGGRNVRLITLLEPGAPSVQTVRVTGDAIEVATASGTHTHIATLEGWDVATPGASVKLRGRQETAKQVLTPIFSDRYEPVECAAIPVAEAPALDGTLEGFVGDAPLTLDYEDQYRRSEEPYPGPEEFSATAYANWNEEGLYLGVKVIKPEVVIRPPEAPPLRLDNEPDDIHSDGLQIYLRPSDDGPIYGVLVVPGDEEGALRAHGVAGTAGASATVRGAWERTETGYCLTMAMTVPEWPEMRHGDRLGFDLLINQMEPDRLRRAGQLVWSGGGGWVWLRGDRQEPARFGILTLQ